MLMIAFGTGSDMPAKGGSAAALNGGHHLQLRQVQMSGVVPAIRRAMGAEDIRNLQLWAGHWVPTYPEPASLRASKSSGLVTSRIVLVATCV